MKGGILLQWKFLFTGIIWLLLFLCTTLGKSQKDDKKVLEMADGESIEVHKKSSIAENGKENIGAIDGSDEDVVDVESCNMDDCAAFQDDADQSELQLLSDQDEENTLGEDGLSSHDFCDSSTKCSKEYPQEPTNADLTEESPEETDSSPKDEITDTDNEVKEEEDENGDLIDESQNSLEDESGKDESKISKLDPELENIPLREILLKLKVGCHLSLFYY